MKTNLLKHRISEKNYLEHVKATLTAIPRDDSKFVIIGLCRKLRGYSDDMDDAPVFVFEAGDPVNNALIIEWAEDIDDKNYRLPALMVNYLVVTMTKEEFGELLESPEALIDDQDFLVVINKYKAWKAVT